MDATPDPRLITLQGLCDIFKTNPILTLINGHGGISENTPLYTDLPENFTLIEIGVVTHSTWQSYIPRVILFLQTLIIKCGENETLTLNDFDGIDNALFILGLIRVYPGGPDMQLYNMTFGGEGDTKSYIRGYENCTLFTNDYKDGQYIGRTGDFLWVDGHAATQEEVGQLRDLGSYNNIIHGLTGGFPDRHQVLINIVCKPSVIKIKSKPITEEITRIITRAEGEEEEDETYMEIYNLIAQIQHMRNAQYLHIEGRLIPIGDNISSLFLARHDYVPSTGDTKYGIDAFAIIEYGARIADINNGKLRDRIDRLLTSALDKRVEEIKEAMSIDDKKSAVLNDFYIQLHQICSNNNFKCARGLAPINESLRPYMIMPLLAQKFYETITEIQDIFTDRVSDVHDLLSEPIPTRPSPIEFIFSKILYGTTPSEIKRWMGDGDYMDAALAFYEYYKDKRDGPELIERVRRNTEPLISHLIRYQPFYPDDKPHGNIYKVLKRFCDQLQTNLCRLCKCKKGDCGTGCMGTSDTCPDLFEPRLTMRTGKPLPGRKGRTHTRNCLCQYPSDKAAIHKIRKRPKKRRKRKSKSRRKTRKRKRCSCPKKSVRRKMKTKRAINN